MAAAASASTSTLPVVDNKDGVVSCIGFPGRLEPDVAKGFGIPCNVCPHVDAKTGVKSTLVAEVWAQCFRQILPDDRVVLLAGVPNDDGYKNGPALEAQFKRPGACIVDPTNSDRIFLADEVSVRLLDRATNQVTLIAGGPDAGFADGTGGAAKFDSINDMIVTADGTTIYLSDASNCRIRSVNVKTGVVKTVAAKTGDPPKATIYGPRGLCFDRTTAAPETAVYLCCNNRFERVDLTNGAVEVIKTSVFRIAFTGVKSMPSGLLVVTEGISENVFSLDPKSGLMTRLAGGENSRTARGYVNGSALKDARFYDPNGLYADEANSCLIVADRSNNAIRKITVPIQLFYPAGGVPAARMKSALEAKLPPDVRKWTVDDVVNWASLTDDFKPLHAALRESTVDGSVLVYDLDESWLTESVKDAALRNQFRAAILQLRATHKVEAARAAPLNAPAAAAPATAAAPVVDAKSAVDVKSAPAASATAAAPPTIAADPELAKAAVTLKDIPRSDDKFDEIELLMKASVGNNDDYTVNRAKAGKKPIAFKLVSAEEIVNPVLAARFERERARLKALNRDANELKLKTGFHGTRESCVSKIATTGLLRVGHPMNPSKSTDPGWFGSPKYGVYLSRNVDYALKYSNGLVPLEPNDTVKVLMFKLISGKSLHVATKTTGMLPTAGYDSHSSANFLEWYLFQEAMCLPTHVLTIKAFEDRRTDADDKNFQG